MTVAKLGSGEKQAYKTMGPVIRQTDGAIAVASSHAMCRAPCPCANITPAGLKTYSTAMQSQITGWKAAKAAHEANRKKNKTPYTGLMFDGEIKNFEQCMAKNTDANVEEANCIKANGGDTKAEAKCAASKKAREQVQKLLKAIEQNFNCQGLCQPSTWWWYGDITTSSPQNGCMIALKQKFSSTAGAAATVMIIAIIVSSCLCISTFLQVCNKKE